MTKQQDEEGMERIYSLTPEELEVIRRASAPTLRDLQSTIAEIMRRVASKEAPTSRLPEVVTVAGN